MWEYKLIYLKYRLFQELTDKLNKEGEENWEVINYHEDKPKEWGNEYEAKILLKRIKINPACTTQEKQ
jgi:hypothetical protein